MFDKYLSINKNFKASVNLQFDLYDESKIKQYVPTTDLCDVIKQYLKSVLTGEGLKSTLLAGPYGKGKSYLMLMITYLLSNHENRELFLETVNKFNCIDSELAKMILEIDSNKINLLPVIINNNSFEDMNQNFMLALKSALNFAGISDVVPSTAYKECLNLIETWENEKTMEFNIFDECLNKLHVDLNSLKNGLSNYEVSCYNKFVELFKCVSHGYTFNPLVSNDISIIFSDVSRQLIKYGFTGIFCVFDEFGVFLDNQGSNFVSKLNKLQTFAEKANSSDKDCQIHFCCITHKDIMLYQKDSELTDEFIKISGRFKQIRFDRSVDENYQIICSALLKDPGYSGLIDAYLADNMDFLDLLYKSTIFSSKEQINYIFNNGFPFNPVSLYSLIQISEKIAQNERTLFTFISDTDIYGFRYFIANNFSKLMNVDSIYDYFENIIKNNDEYKSIYMSVEAVKNQSVKDIEHSIFKTIAVIKIINDNIKFPITIRNIALSLAEKEEYIQKIIDSLINKNLLKLDVNDHTVDFSIISNSTINRQIQDIIGTKFRNENILEILNYINDHKFYVSNKYNIEACITRFFCCKYIESSKLKQLISLESLFTEDCDGLVINVYNDDKSSKDEIFEKIKTFNCSNVIIRFSNKPYQKKIIEKIKTLFGASELMKNIKLSDDTKTILKILIDDYSLEINKYMDDYYLDSSLINPCVHAKSLNELMYKCLTHTYAKNIIFNNEMVNKNNPSSVIVKSRNAVVDAILIASNQNFGTTSAEATIKYCLEDSVKNNPEIISFIKNFIVESVDGKVSLKELYKILTSKPYGIRKGIIPLLLSVALSELSIATSKGVNEVLLFNNSMQVVLNSSNLSRTIDNPDKYYFYYAQLNIEKMAFVKSMLEQFKCKELLSFSDSAKLLTSKITSEILNMSPIIVKSTVKDNILGLSINELAFKEMFLKPDLNPFDVLFDELPKLFSCDIEKLKININSTFNSYKEKIKYLYDSTIKNIKDKLIPTNDTLKSSYNLWKHSYDTYIDDIVFNNECKKIYAALNSLKFNDNDSINILSNAILNCTLDDWNSKKKNLFYSKIEFFIEKVKNYDSSTSISKKSLIDNYEGYQLSTLGNTLYSNLKESIDEYGTSITNEEKAQILKKILNDILN